jgi:putative pyruvate formate lyase activating enzyme
MSNYEKILSHCRLCGHACGADRQSGETGTCGAGPDMVVARHLLHFGEEPPISGEHGSGTIFFTHCPLSCAFCQNFQISQQGLGHAVTIPELADMMLDLQNQGAHNINFVSPTPYVVHIAQAVTLARKQKLKIPIVYNTGGFDSPAALKIATDFVDIYLPDLKIAEPENAGRDSEERIISGKLYNARNYAVVNRAALKEMHRQKGFLTFDDNGMAAQGMLVRHLVLPNNLSRTNRALTWLAETFSTNVWISLMAQYRPMHRVVTEPGQYPDLQRPLTETEYQSAMDTCVSLGLENVFIQDLEAVDTYVPDFETEGVFEKKSSYLN